MDDYLSKPVKMGDLEEMLAKYRSNATTFKRKSIKNLARKFVWNSSPARNRNFPGSFNLSDQSGIPLSMRLIPMKNTHHAEMQELVIGRDLSWMDQLQALINQKLDRKI